MKAEYPYARYNLYKVWHKNQKRWYAQLVNGKERTTISYARYTMAVKLKRILSSQEHVDHVDGDKSNDSYNNLQILSIAENNRKSILERGLSSKLIKLICPACQSKFERPPNQVNTKIARGKHPTCSKRCGGIHSHNKTLDILPN